MTSTGIEPAPGPIVVGVDGSSACFSAVRWAVRDAARWDRCLRLVHVCQVTGRDHEERESDAVHARERGREWLHEAGIVARVTNPALGLGPGRVRAGRGQPGGSVHIGQCLRQ